ncbi:MAG: prepilin-type N-terminal cleavage/methylation domain-containing protein [Mariprofundaceae bacterium]|nr:prepilin-type N-terminal cleavage/methylation domain-containing protein [Mariprofundaceae bacterium]
MHIRQTFVARRGEAGFTLIELMVAMLIALIIMAGLYASFSKQSTEYSYQNRRIDAVQDLEFAIKFITDDLRASLVIGGVSSVVTTDDVVGRTTDLQMTVWDQNVASWAAPPNDGPTKNFRAVRRYVLVVDPNNAAQFVLRYERNLNDGNNNPVEILPNITYFKVFVDGVTPRVVPAGNPNAGLPYPGIPAALPVTSLQDSGGLPVNGIRGYTVLVEMAVQAGYNQGLMQDVLGNPTTNKRVWRYIQVYPQSSAN